MNTHTHLDTEQLISDLAWEFCEESKQGRAVNMKTYLDQLPDNECRVHFKKLVNTDLLLRGVVELRKQEVAVA